MIKEDECIACSLYDHGTDVTVIPPKTRNDVVASELYGTVIGLGAGNTCDIVALFRPASLARFSIYKT